MSSTNLIKVFQGKRVKRYDMNAALLSAFLFSPIEVLWTDNPIEFYSGSNVYWSGSNSTISLSGSITGSFFMSLGPEEGFIRQWVNIIWSGSNPAGSLVEVDLIDSKGITIASGISSPYTPVIGEEELFNGTGEETAFTLNSIPSMPLTEVTINDVNSVENSDFTVDYVIGQLFFNVPPPIGVGNIKVRYSHPGTEALTLRFNLSGSTSPTIDWIVWEYAVSDRLPYELGGVVTV